ncbi:MAG: hypothetical protein Q9174_005538, partial [Haloplaca sp. 1 TL-2023]
RYQISPDRPYGVPRLAETSTTKDPFLSPLITLLLILVIAWLRQLINHTVHTARMLWPPVTALTSFEALPSLGM